MSTQIHYGPDRAQIQAICEQSVASLREAGKIASQLVDELPNRIDLASEVLLRSAAGIKETGEALRSTLSGMRPGLAAVSVSLAQLARDWPLGAVVEPESITEPESIAELEGDWMDDLTLQHDLRGWEITFGPLWD